MRFLAVLVAALLGLAPLAAGAHGGHQHESPVTSVATVIPEQVAPQEIVAHRPCPGGEQTCGCHSLGGCRDGKAPALVPGFSLVPSAARGIEIQASAQPRASRPYPSSRPRAPPAFS